MKKYTARVIKPTHSKLANTGPNTGWFSERWPLLDTRKSMPKKLKTNSIGWMTEVLALIVTSEYG